MSVGFGVSGSIIMIALAAGVGYAFLRKRGGR